MRRCLAWGTQVLRSPIVKGKRLGNEQFGAFATPDYSTFGCRAGCAILLALIIYETIAVVVYAVAPEGGVIGCDIPIHIPSIERIQIEFKRCHDRIGIAEINDIDSPLGEASRGFFRWRRADAVKVDLNATGRQRHRQHLQMLGVVIPGQVSIRI